MSVIKSGVWQTDTGSSLRLIIDESGRVSGHFSSAHGQPDPCESFPLTGFVNGPLIGFTVAWGDYKSITSWAGVLGTDDGRECIHAAWHLVREYADRAHTQKNEYWESFIAYTGTYYYTGE